LDYKELLEKMENTDGFFKHNNYHIVKAKSNDIIISVDITENSMNPYGIVHGAIIFGLGDTVMGMVARETGRNAVTLTSSVTYLHPGKGKVLYAEGKMIKNGKSTCFLRANIYNENKELIATMDSSYFYIS
jgi:acyl-CoA thioesterase